MSASLVGSEMCIRDSCFKRPHSSLLLACGLPLPAGRPPGGGGGGGAAPPCLLYTSDAADDM
eukprot:4512888-Alexandrium_andersonii.AAC.1